MAERRLGRRTAALLHVHGAWRGVAALAALSVLLAVGDRTRLIDTGALRNTVSDSLAPALGLLTRPVDAVSGVAATFTGMIDASAENQRLRIENGRLQTWQSVALQLERENAELRRLSNLRPPPRLTYVTTRVIADPGGPFVRTLLLNAGTSSGVTAGSAVTDGFGLVGRIVQAGERTSRVLLLTDLNSRVPVVLERTGVRGLLSGTNARHAVLSYTQQGRIEPGDRIVTSGDGGLFAPDIAVGEVMPGRDGELHVRLYADADRLDYVRVLRTGEGAPVLPEPGSVIPSVRSLSGEIYGPPPPPAAGVAAAGVARP